MHIVDINPKVSIILPTYNRAGLIMSSIESVQKQVYSNWELIVIDDQSVDDTGTLVKSINDTRIRYVPTQQRLGIVGSRNEGIRHATGTLLAFIDSDDIWLPEKLEKQVNALGENPGSAFSLTGGYNFKNLGEPTEFFYKQQEGSRYGDIYLALFQSEVAATMPTLLLRRQCVEHIGLSDESTPLPDMDFIFRLAKCYKAVVLFEPLFCRRIHDENYSTVNWLKRQQQGLAMLKIYQSTLPASVRRNCFYKSRINFGEQCLSHKMPGKAMIQFMEAWKIKPFSMAAYRKMAKAAVYGLRN